MEIETTKFNKEMFDYYWKIALIIILIGSLTYMLIEFKNLNTKGITCSKQPFLYGAQVMVEKYGDEGFMTCSCTLGNDETTRQYSFTESEENPSPQSIYTGLNLD